jgi:hypothetical protein
VDADGLVVGVSSGAPRGAPSGTPKGFSPVDGVDISGDGVLTGEVPGDAVGSGGKEGSVSSEGPSLLGTAGDEMDGWLVLAGGRRGGTGVTRGVGGEEGGRTAAVQLLI